MTLNSMFKHVFYVLVHSDLIRPALNVVLKQLLSSYNKFKCCALIQLICSGNKAAQNMLQHFHIENK